MPIAINDEFAPLPMSRQRKYQLRKVRDGKCPICGKASRGKYFCVKHRLATKTDPQRVNCWRIFSNALQQGKIARGKCWCGKLGQGHHYDYSKPLDVIWLCHRHHMEAHGRQCYTERPIRIENVREYQLNYYRKRYENSLSPSARARLTARRSRKNLAKKLDGA